MSGPTVEVVFTEAELWCIIDLVRETQAHNREWAKLPMRELQEAVLTAKVSTFKKATVRLDAADCWAISRQIPSGLSVGTQNVGRTILESVFLALRELEPLEATEEAEPDAPGESAVPAAFAAWSQEEARAQAVWVKMQEEEGTVGSD